MGLDRAVAMMEGAGVVTDKLMSHKMKTSWCFWVNLLKTGMLETSLSSLPFVFAGKPVAVN